jgi:tetratricopeptide (TPR) repeat protein
VLRPETDIGRQFDRYDATLPPASTEVGVGDLQRDGGATLVEADRWLDTLGAPRFFLFFHIYEPHSPYTPPARFRQYAPYDGEIAYADEIAGRLLDSLKRRGLYDRALIVLLSDHGEGLGDHGEQEHGLFVYDEAIHVPLIIKQAENLGAGRRVADLVQHLDLVPTILDYVKAPIPGTLHGRSLKPLLEGTGHPPEQAVYAEALYARYHFGWSELTALTDTRYRYIKAPRAELYDLERDPHERQNLADNRGTVTRALAGALDRLTAGTMIQAPGDVSAEARERLQALGYVGAQAGVPGEPGDALPDPKDKREILERYRAAVDLAGDRKWADAIALLRQILDDEPEMADVWSQLATFAIRTDRYDLAIDAYKHFIELEPSDPSGYLGAAGAYLRLRKLDDARAHAELAAEVAPERDARSRASSHELLAKIALARHNADQARSEAELARQADPALPMPPYIEARLLSDQGQYADALPLFQQAIAELKKSGALQMTELHFYTADTLGRLERYPEAEKEFLEELRYFPQNTRARSGLAMLYQATGRPDLAATTIRDMIRITPTPDAYALAARLWSMFGDPQQANAVRAEARRAFADPRRAGTHAARH